MSSDQKEILNELYDVTPYTIGPEVVSMLSKKAIGELLGAPENIKGTLFAGAGFLFSKLNHSWYEKEIKRHNEALEKLAKAKEKRYENQVK